MLLHGLARTARSMRPLIAPLESAGFRVCNIGYPSRHFPIDVLAQDHVLPPLQRCVGNARRVHFVTHSMGGIVLRKLAADGALRAVGRVVMLAPPNGGSEAVDWFGHTGWFRALNGPAGLQLGTAPDGFVAQLGAAPFALGVIAGSRTFNPMSARVFGGASDGKVAVERTKLRGMHGHVVVPATHTFLMRRADVQQLTVRFLQTGSFDAR